VLGANTERPGASAPGRLCIWGKSHNRIRWCRNVREQVLSMTYIAA
jgi:hypothetical protein